MDAKIFRWVGMGALLLSMSAHAGLTSVDNGLAVEDAGGLMFANTIGLDKSFSPTGGAGTGQAWIAQLNAENYGGYDDWSLATGKPGNANPMSNQLGELFYQDCHNSIGKQTSMVRCGAFTSLTQTIKTGLGPFPLPGAALFMGSYIGPVSLGNGRSISSYNVYDTSSSSVRYWDSDSTYSGQVGLVDAIAVRNAAAPEIDAGGAAAAVTLLLGVVAIQRSRKRYSPVCSHRARRRWYA